MKRVLLPTSVPNYAVDETTGDIRIRPRKKLLERLPPTASRNAAFNLLHEGLAVATEFFQHHGDGGRYGVYRAMADLVDYFTSRGIPHAAIKPIEAVMAAIVDADNGVANPIFDPKREGSGGRPRKPVMQLAFEGQMGIVMECCVRHCRAQGQRPYVEPAAKQAAKLINASAWPVTVTAKQLVEIRERIQQSASNSPDRMEVDQSLSSEMSRVMPLDWAKLLLSHEWVNPPPKLSE
ncbi:MAG TPA: hypothetical protein VKC17_05945 [Sphingomicrobium sp.]|nr:hypothetical protein [Sphingomicrobium sp.]